MPGCHLQHARLNNANLQGANLAGADLTNCDLQGANLQGANLQGAILQGANVQYTNLLGAKLHGASLHGITNVHHAKGLKRWYCYPVWVFCCDWFMLYITSLFMQCKNNILYLWHPLFLIYMQFHLRKRVVVSVNFNTILFIISIQILMKSGKLTRAFSNQTRVARWSRQLQHLAPSSLIPFILLFPLVLSSTHFKWLLESTISKTTSSLTNVRYPASYIYLYLEFLTSNRSRVVFGAESTQSLDNQMLPLSRFAFLVLLAKLRILNHI